MSFAAKIAEISYQDQDVARLEKPRPILILTINNGAAHTRAAEAIAESWRKINCRIPARIVEVSEFMSRKARFTHVTAYLWLVKNVPALWEKIDAYQKRQPNTAPTWFYRRECRKLFDLAREIQPVALVATEVGCGEIGALIKSDLGLRIPLAAVNLDYDADRAWVQPEVDLYCLATFLIEKNFLNLGAEAEKVKIWGAPLASQFRNLSNAERFIEREKVCHWLGLNPNKPLVLVTGGGEGLGKIEAIITHLLRQPVQIVVLTGNNRRLKKRCEKIGCETRIKVLGWTEKIAPLMQSADILISKLGLTFYEAMACGLPMIALEPPPGAERVQYNLLESFGTGRAVKTVEDVVKTVTELLENQSLLKKMRAKTQIFGQMRAAEKLALWLQERIEKNVE